MILLILLLFTAIILIIGAVIGISAFGAGAIFVFGDVFVCIGVIVLLCVRIFSRRIKD